MSSATTTIHVNLAKKRTELCCVHGRPAGDLCPHCLGVSGGPTPEGPLDSRWFEHSSLEIKSVEDYVEEIALAKAGGEN